MRIRRTVPLALAGTGLVLMAGAGPALADTTPTPAGRTAGTSSADQLAYVQARVHAAVDGREVTITRLGQALAARTHVTDAHRSSLSGLFAADAAGLKAVDSKVQADTTCDQAVTDGRTVVTDYRVYLLLVPQTHLVSAADAGSWATAQVTAAEPKAQAAVDAVTDAATKAKAQALLDAMTAQASAAAADFDGVSDGMLALTPADIPAKQSTIDGFRARVADGRAALTKSVADAKALRSLLS